jgi:transcriptional regulator with XRE-family HTH domain
MPEIGATLRETRIRAGLEISDIEATTKIRAKYLRAIENEEWGLLPGPTFVKSFLRTYAETLGLDARLLLEEYKMRYERFDDLESPRPMPIGSATEPGRMRPPRGSGGGRRRWWPIALVLVAAVAVAVVLLTGGSDDKGSGSTVTTVSHASKGSDTTSTREKTTTTRKRPPVPRTRLQILPGAPVSACLVADGKKVLTGGVLQPDTPPGTFTARKFRLALGNGNAKLKIDGKTSGTLGAADPVAYAISNGKRTKLSGSDVPVCQ